MNDTSNPAEGAPRQSVQEAVKLLGNAEEKAREIKRIIAQTIRFEEATTAKMVKDSLVAVPRIELFEVPADSLVTRSDLAPAFESSGVLRRVVEFVEEREGWKLITENLSMRRPSFEIKKDKAAVHLTLRRLGTGPF